MTTTEPQPTIATVAWLTTHFVLPTRELGEGNVEWSEITEALNRDEWSDIELADLWRLANRHAAAANELRRTIGDRLGKQLGRHVIRYGDNAIASTANTRVEQLVTDEVFWDWVEQQPSTVLRNMFNPPAAKKTAFPDYHRGKGSLVWTTMFDVVHTSYSVSMSPVVKGPNWWASLPEGGVFRREKSGQIVAKEEPS